MSCTYCNRQYNMTVGSYIKVPMTTRLSVTSKLQWTLVPTGNPEGVTLSLNRRNMVSLMLFFSLMLFSFNYCWFFNIFFKPLQAKFLTQTQIDGKLCYTERKCAMYNHEYSQIKTDMYSTFMSNENFFLWNCFSLWFCMFSCRVQRMFLALWQEAKGEDWSQRPYYCHALFGYKSHI